MLEIIDLHVEVAGKEIIKGVSLQFKSGQIHALMGPNGSGKSTLAHALMGHPAYKITKGKIMLDGQDISSLKTDQRAKKGLFLSFQYPAEIPGLGIANYLRTIVNNKLEEKDRYSVLDFHKVLKQAMAYLKMDSAIISRSLNEGFSGGEKKRMEMLQLMLLGPRYALLDETDSGLDVDAIRTVAEGINKVHRQSGMGIVVITHYNRFLEYLKPERVSILFKGKIVAEGGFELAKKIEAQGFGEIIA